MRLTKKEILSFQGHEFTYVFENGDTMPAYIKKIDLKSNLCSYWSFSLTTNNGHTFKPLDDDEEKENACCLGKANLRGEIEKIINEIKKTGKVVCKYKSGHFTGCPF